MDLIHHKKHHKHSFGNGNTFFQNEVEIIDIKNYENKQRQKLARISSIFTSHKGIKLFASFIFTYDDRQQRKITYVKHQK